MGRRHSVPANAGDQLPVTAERRRRVELYRRQYARTGHITYEPAPADIEGDAARTLFGIAHGLGMSRERRERDEPRRAGTGLEGLGC